MRPEKGLLSSVLKGKEQLDQTCLLCPVIHGKGLQRLTRSNAGSHVVLGPLAQAGSTLGSLWMAKSGMEAKTYPDALWSAGTPEA
ncbi:hypothetical protein N7535_002576 [Penicillium sp. DV-2018c]|nr:hypothetical protein N7535_002576 [Penicillium sp. DV-2018c]